MPLIDKKTIDQIYQAIDIVDVVGEFVTLRKAGANYKGLCPFHDEKTPSFVVTPSKGICHCFGCQKGGNAINFLMELNNWTYPEAIRWLAKKYHIEIIETETDQKAHEEQKHREELISINQWANNYFQHTLHETNEGKGIGMNYLRSRGFRDDIIKKFQIGYCPSNHHALLNEAQANHLNIENLKEVGLCICPDNGKPYDRFHGRVMFPIHNQLGKVVAFGGRILEKRENVGKYVNSPESTIYSKSRELYGLFFARQAIQRNNCCYMVEGYTDVISMHQCGIENVVASSGTALTHDQIRLVKKFTTNMTVLYDGDNAGIKASLRGIDMFLEHGFNIKVLLLPDGDDPDSFARKHSAEKYVDYINGHQVDFIRFKTNLLLKDADNDIHARSQVINNIAESIALIDDTITRSLYIKECANLTGIREDDVINTINSFRNRNQYQKLNERERVGQTHLGTHIDKSKPTIVSATPIADKNTTYSATAIAELNMMKYIVRYGEITIERYDSSEDSGTPLCLTEFISASLNATDFKLSNPVYAEIISEIIQNRHIPNFKAATYLLSHPSDAIRNTALSLSTDKDSSINVDEKSITQDLSQIADKLISQLVISSLEDKISRAYHLINSGTLTPEQTLVQVKEIQECKKIQNALKKQA